MSKKLDIKNMVLEADKLKFNGTDDYRITLIKAFILYAKARNWKSLPMDNVIQIIEFK